MTVKMTLSSHQGFAPFHGHPPSYLGFVVFHGDRLPGRLEALDEAEGVHSDDLCSCRVG